MQNAWKIPDLRKKILFTLLVIIVFRIGANMPAPFLNMEALAGLMGFVTDSSSANAFAYLNTLSGGAFAQATLFAMSVTPYINSSIIMQLLTVAIPPLERMAKEGEEGRKKIGAITRYVAVVLGLVQGLAYYLYLRGSSYEGTPIVTYTEGAAGVFTAIVIVLVFTAGTAMMMWLGEQINRRALAMVFPFCCSQVSWRDCPIRSTFWCRLSKPHGRLPILSASITSSYRCSSSSSWPLSGSSYS